MICGKCKKEKHPCLFSPSQVKKSGVHYCRVCMEESKRLSGNCVVMSGGKTGRNNWLFAENGRINL